MISKFALSLAAVLLPLSAAAADEPKEPRAIGVEASIAFPDHGAVRNFETDGDDGIWIEDQRRGWYYGTFIGPCSNANFAQAIAIDTRGSSRLDKFGTIIVGRDRCALLSFVTAEKPLPRKERAALKKAARDAAATTAQN